MLTKLRDGDEIRNFMKNVDGTTVICDKIDGITVISKLVLPPGGSRDSLTVEPLMKRARVFRNN